MQILVAAGTALSLVFAAGVAVTDRVHWSYSGEAGPENWHRLSPDFATCSAGHMQSPIDLGAANARGMVEVAADYHAAPLTLLNNGHTIQANFPAGSTLVSGGQKFGLLQVHFHTPSEHAVSGKRYPLVAHFVHRDESGRLAVLGIFFEEGAENAELAKLIAAAPEEEGEPHDVHGVNFDPAAMLPSDLAVYRYMGSLTTPPCSEGVNWHVAMQPMTASTEQLAKMHELMGENARPIQPAHNRLIVSR